MATPLNYRDRLAVGSLAVDGVIQPSTATIDLAASATTDGMTITVTVRDAAGKAVPATTTFTLWMSEAATGAGLTADTYSGDLTIVSGYGLILVPLTAKKAWIVQTNSSGVFKATLVASANPADQYVVAALPLAGGVVVSGVSGTNWEGA
jgi:hypothetical protein